MGHVAYMRSSRDRRQLMKEIGTGADGGGVGAAGVALSPSVYVCTRAGGGGDDVRKWSDRVRREVSPSRGWFIGR